MHENDCMIAAVINIGEFHSETAGCKQGSDA
jgi:hypothetical protein